MGNSKSKSKASAASNLPPTNSAPDPPLPSEVEENVETTRDTIVDPNKDQRVKQNPDDHHPDNKKFSAHDYVAIVDRQRYCTDCLCLVCLL